MNVEMVLQALAPGIDMTGEDGPLLLARLPA